MARVNVIINCYNGEKFLAETLNSIYQQTYKDFEVIFFDNCSTDSSAEIAKKHTEKIRYYRTKKTIPLGEARNKALQLTDAEYIAFVDCDDIWDLDKIELQVDVLDKYSDCGMVFSNFNKLNMMSGEVQCQDKDKKDKLMDFEDIVGNYSFCLSSFMIRKQALEGLEHSFNVEFKYAEEFELFSRIALNWKTAYIAKPLVTYRIHSGMNTLKLQDRIGYEYNIALENLKKMEPDLSTKYPLVEKKICFFRDLADAKYIIRKGDNKKVRALMKPYIGYNKRAICFYVVACMPNILSKMIVDSFYKKRI